MAAMEKNNKNLNVPNLRFPEFSGEWKETTIGECCSELEYGMNAPSKYFDGVNKYIRITDIDEQTSEYKQDSVVSPDAPLEDKYIVKDRDILFARTGASTGKTYIYNPQDGKMYYAGFLIRANVKMEDNPKFVFYQTQTHRYKKWVSIMSMRSGQPGINSQEYASYKFWKPCKDEQDKISALISLLDTRIQTQKKIIEKYESLIRGLYHSVFNNPSSILQLREVVSIVKGKQVNGEELLEEGKYYVMNGGTEPSGYLDEYNTPANTISISEGGNSCGYVQYNTEPFWSGGHCYSLHQKDEGVNYSYLYHFLKYKERDIMALRIGSGLPNVQKKDLERFEVRVLPIEQQDRVAEILEDISAKCDLEKKILQEWQWQKSFLLSNLFI